MASLLVSVLAVAPVDLVLFCTIFLVQIHVVAVLSLIELVGVPVSVTVVGVYVHLA